MRALSQALVILVVAALCSAAGYLLRPSALPWDVDAFALSFAETQALPDPIWLDARVEADFAQGSLPGALLLSLEDWEAGFEGLLAVWTPDRPVVVFCSSQACLRSHEVAERLRGDLGTEEVFTLEGGWEALIEAGAVARKEGDQ